jgi:hypothetical protein
MSKPIPADVLDAARQAYGLIAAFGWEVMWRSNNHVPDDAWPIDILARAILAERERCAAIAEEDVRSATAIRHSYKPTWYMRAEDIAKAIRNGTPSPASIEHRGEVR